MKNFYKANVIRLFLALIIFYAHQGYAQQGRDGAETITTANTIVNESTSLTSNANTGNTSITVANSAVNAHNRFTSPLASGDLIMIIQMQGATINGTATDSTWGTITSYNNCGLYEFSEVAGVPNSTTITLGCALKNNYSDSGHTQVVRVPRYTTLTINPGDTLTADAWNGSTGGIVAVEVEYNTVIDSAGTISATGDGFRGGVVVNNSGSNYTDGFAGITSAIGGTKGEGIAGFNTTYNVYGGMFGRGAAANAGGGGDQWNSSGGGGANAGNITAYTGDGNPDTSNLSWITAWNLEYSGFAYSSSSGGGRGGYSIEWIPIGTPSPLIYPPGNRVYGDTSYDDQRNRQNVGGKGGRPLDYSTGRIFLGGGGGAGHEDQGIGGSGGAGGGIIYLLDYGSVDGKGSIISNGINGGNNVAGGGLGDGCGGAGAGGTILLYAIDSINNITITANGGAGGNQYFTSTIECEGGGGGGGGGYIATSSNAFGITDSASGGVNGTTNDPLAVLFPPDGATMGGNGLTKKALSSVSFSSVVANAGPNVNICPGGSANLSASGGTFYSWSPSTNLSCDTCSNPVANPLVTTIYVVTVTSGTCSGIDSVVVTVSNALAGTISSPVNALCAGDATDLSLTGNAGTIQWQSSVSGNNFTDIPGADSTTHYVQPSQTTYYRVYTDTGSCTDTSQPLMLTVNPSPVAPVISASDSVVCLPDSVLITSTGSYSQYLWNNGDTTSSIYVSVSGGYNLTVTAQGGCTAVSGIQNVTAHSQPQVPVISADDSAICSSDSARLSVPHIYSFYLWNDGDTSSYTYVNQAGGYWVTVTDINGCSSVSGHQVISVYPVPSVSIIVEGDTLSSFGAVAYQWYLNDTAITRATSAVYIAHQSGDYTVQITDTNGCTSLSSPISIMVTGISELTGDFFGIYPNPFLNTIIITVNDPSKKIEQVEIYDVLGKTVFTKKINEITNTTIKLDLKALSEGVYYVRISVNGMDYIKQIIKE